MLVVSARFQYWSTARTVTLNGTSDIRTNSKTLTIDGQVTGGGGFNKFGGQSLTLSNNTSNLEFDKKVKPFVNDTATTKIYTLSLHDALPI